MKIITEDSYGLSKRQVKYSNLYQALLCATQEGRSFNYLPSETMYTLGNPRMAKYECKYLLNNVVPKCNNDDTWNLLLRPWRN